MKTRNDKPLNWLLQKLLQSDLQFLTNYKATFAQQCSFVCAIIQLQNNLTIYI